MIAGSDTQLKESDMPADKRVATTSCLINTVQSGVVQLSECSMTLPLPRLDL